MAEAVSSLGLLSLCRMEEMAHLGEDSGANQMELAVEAAEAVGPEVDRLMVRVGAR